MRLQAESLRKQATQHLLDLFAHYIRWQTCSDVKPFGIKPRGSWQQILTSCRVTISERDRSAQINVCECDPVAVSDDRPAICSTLVRFDGRDLTSKRFRRGLRRCTTGQDHCGDCSRNHRFTAIDD